MPTDPNTGDTRNPGYFAPRPPADGRFSVAAPNGTCYLALSESVAALEIMAPEFIEDGEIPWEETLGWEVACVEFPGLTKTAAVSSPDASRYKVTTELTSTDQYDITQQWAERLREAGFEAILYTARFTPGEANSVAWFKEAGSHPMVIKSARGVAAICHDAGLSLGQVTPPNISGWKTKTPPAH